MPHRDNYAYLIGVGSNIDPQINCALVIDELLQKFGCVSLSSTIVTLPDGIETSNKFINFMAYLNTGLSIDEIKQWSNALEIRLGRDRTHPQRKLIDRPADIDIIQQMKGGELFDLTSIGECYFQQVSGELRNHLMGLPTDGKLLPCCVLFLADGSEVGDGASTINLDRATGDVRIVQ